MRFPGAPLNRGGTARPFIAFAVVLLTSFTTPPHAPSSLSVTAIHLRFNIRASPDAAHSLIRNTAHSSLSRKRTLIPSRRRQCLGISQLAKGVGQLIAGIPLQRSPVGYLITRMGHLIDRVALQNRFRARLIPRMRHLIGSRRHWIARNALRARRIASLQDRVGHLIMSGT